MASMLDNIKGLITPVVLSRLTGQTGESESAVAKGFGAAIPAMLGAVADRSDDQDFIESLADIAARTAAEPDPFKRSALLSSSGSGIDTTTEIGGWLSNLFGHNLSGVTDAIARYSGIRGLSATSLLAMCAPLVLGYLGRLMRTDNLSAAGLAERLRSERPELASALPPGFDLPRSVRAPVETHYETARRMVAASDRDAASWSFPVMLLLGTLGIGGLIWWAASQHEDQVRARMGGGVTDVVGTTGTISGMLSRPLPGNTVLRIPAGGTEDRLSMYLAAVPSGSTTIDFDRIEFDTGSASLTPSSHQQIRNVAAILRAYPRTSVIVAGHTDNVGDEQANLALSRARAESVASALTEAGVAAERVTAEGFGSRNPIADNSTDTGRSQNRRVALEVAVK